MGDLLISSPWSVSAQGLENTIWLLGFWHGRVLSVRRKIGAALCTFYFLVFFFIIMKSLQLRGHKQISESHKYCLVRVIVFFGVYFFYFFCFSQVENSS